jgi:hypothetical protein
MMSRSTWTLLGVLLVLILVAVYVLQRPGERSSGDTSGNMLVSFDSSAVNRIEIRSREGEVTLQKDNGVWMLESPLRYRADQTSVLGAIAKARSIGVKNVVSSNPERFSLFQVDSSGTLVRLLAGNTVLASFFVGKPSSSFNETYARITTANDVVVADGMFGYMFSRSPKDWRDKTILPVAQNEIQTVRFTYGDTTFTLQRADSGWTVDGMKAKQGAVDELLGSLGRLTADGFIDTTFTPPGPPVATISVNGTDLRFYGGKPDYQIQTSGAPQWYAVQDWKAKAAMKRKGDFGG